MIEQHVKKENTIKSPIKYLFIVLGILCMVLGTIGIILPIIPTTPFLLLASFFFIRSSEYLYRKLIENKYFGELIYNYEKHRAIKRSTKVRAITLLWVCIIISAIIAPIWWVKILIIVIAMGVTKYLLSLKEY